MRFAARNGEKFTITPPFLGGGSRSFKVIDVDIPKKFVASACYDKQHVWTYLQPFYARELAELAIARISYGNSVCLYVCPSWCHVLVPLQAQVR